MTCNFNLKYSVDTPYGYVREIHLRAACNLYKDVLQRRVEPQDALVCACHLVRVSPASAAILQFWLENICPGRMSWADESDELCLDRVSFFNATTRQRTSEI